MLNRFCKPLTFQAVVMLTHAPAGGKSAEFARSEPDATARGRSQNSWGKKEAARPSEMLYDACTATQVVVL